MFIYLCVSRHFPVYVRHTFIISLFLYGASLGAAPARRLFLRRNFLIKKIERELQFL